MQSPLVNLGLGLLMVAIGMNLAGVYEFGMRLMGVGQSLTTGNAERQRAQNGILHGLCLPWWSRPPARPLSWRGRLGYALAQPAAVALRRFPRAWA